MTVLILLISMLDTKLFSTIYCLFVNYYCACNSMNGTLLIIEKGNFVTLLKDPSIVFKRNFHLMY